MFGQDTSQNQPSDNTNGWMPPPPVDDPTPDASLGNDQAGAPSVPASDAEDSSKTSSFAPAPSPANGSDDLASIKQQALQQLSPLVSHLDQTPEEKFRTTMMMIQASDDQSLIKSAYDAAQAITDEKARAQALLAVVNEINYFTQHGAAPQNQA